MASTGTIRLQYRLLNVFATGAEFSGNPLCVFEDGGALTTEGMQRLARQFNLSETTFILPSETASAKIRIFTPAYEMPFAGHPTLGTAFVVNDLKSLAGKVQLQMAAGIIPVASPETGVWRLTANRPRWRELENNIPELAAALSLTANDVAGPVLWVDSGNEQLLVPVNSTAAVLRAMPQSEKLAHMGPTFKTLIFYREGDFVRARFFFRQLTGFAEDPATGSACANLGGWFLATKFGSTHAGPPWPRRPHDIPVFRLPFSCAVSQGTEIGRPSELKLAIDANETITVAGIVRELGRGYVDVNKRT